MMIEDRFFDQMWVQELSNEDFRMLLYLFKFASKCGIVELNMRMLNFTANTGRDYTKEEVLERFGNILKLIPGRTDTAIFPDYIATNWAKGKPVDIDRAPLFRGVVNELSSFGLTIADVNRMAKKKIVLKGDAYDEPVGSPSDTEDTKSKGLSTSDAEVMFNAFWSGYPSSCPRKVDKKKCREKFVAILKKSKDPVSMFNGIMNGLERWSKCDQWTRDGGQYIMAPARWINNRNWEDIPTKGAGNANTKRHNGASHIEEKVNGIF